MENKFMIFDKQILSLNNIRSIELRECKDNFTNTATLVFTYQDDEQEVVAAKTSATNEYLTKKFEDIKNIITKKGNCTIHELEINYCPECGTILGESTST